MFTAIGPGVDCTADSCSFRVVVVAVGSRRIVDLGRQAVVHTVVVHRLVAEDTVMDYMVDSCDTRHHVVADNLMRPVVGADSTVDMKVFVVVALLGNHCRHQLLLRQAVV